MAYNETIIAIEARFETEIALAGAPGPYPTIYMNESEQDFTKPDDDVYIEHSIKPAGTFTNAVSNTVEYRMPIVMFSKILCPIGNIAKVRKARVLGKLIEDKFAYFDLDVGDSENTVVSFGKPDYNEIGRVQGQYQINVSVIGDIDYRV